MIETVTYPDLHASHPPRAPWKVHVRFRPRRGLCACRARGTYEPRRRRVLVIGLHVRAFRLVVLRGSADHVERPGIWRSSRGRVGSPFRHAGACRSRAMQSIERSAPAAQAGISNHCNGIVQSAHELDAGSRSSGSCRATASRRSRPPRISRDKEMHTARTGVYFTAKP